MKPAYRFPVTLPERDDILIVQKDREGRKLVSYQVVMSSKMSAKIWDAFVTKFDAVKAVAAAEGSWAGESQVVPAPAGTAVTEAERGQQVVRDDTVKTVVGPGSSRDGS